MTVDTGSGKHVLYGNDSHTSTVTAATGGAIAEPQPYQEAGGVGVVGKLGEC